MKSIKKLLLAITVVILGIGSASAVTYRGFVDLDVGYNTSEYNGAGLQLSTTHGVQWHGLFGGIGIGGNITLLGEGPDVFMVSVPIYANVRYDFFSSKRTNFFASVKLGYTVGMGKWNDFENRTDEISCKSKGGLFFQPTLGLRLKSSSHTGVSIGLTMFNQNADFRQYSGNYFEGDPDIVKTWSKSLQNIGLVFSFDF